MGSGVGSGVGVGVAGSTGAVGVVGSGAGSAVVVSRAVPVAVGSDELPTREGTFSVFSKSRDHVSTLYDTSMPFAMFFSGGQAVHYSPDFAANGYSGASHGCVNVRDYDAVAGLFDQVREGDDVIVYRS